MCGRQMTIPVLNLVKMLDQEVTATRCVAKQCADVFARRRIDSAPFRRPADARAISFGWGLNGHS